MCLHLLPHRRDIPFFRHLSDDILWNHDEELCSRQHISGEALGIARVTQISSISFMFAELPADSQVHDQDAGPCDGDDRFHLPGNFVHQQRTSLELAFCISDHSLLHRLQVSGKPN